MHMDQLAGNIQRHNSAHDTCNARNDAELSAIPGVKRMEKHKSVVAIDSMHTPCASTEPTRSPTPAAPAPPALPTLPQPPALQPLLRETPHCWLLPSTLLRAARPPLLPRWRAWRCVRAPASLAARGRMAWPRAQPVSLPWPGAPPGSRTIRKPAANVTTVESAACTLIHKTYTHTQTHQVTEPPVQLPCARLSH